MDDDDYSLMETEDRVSYLNRHQDLRDDRRLTETHQNEMQRLAYQEYYCHLDHDQRNACLKRTGRKPEPRRCCRKWNIAIGTEPINTVGEKILLFFHGCQWKIERTSKITSSTEFQN